MSSQWLHFCTASSSFNVNLTCQDPIFFHGPVGCHVVCRNDVVGDVDVCTLQIHKNNACLFIYFENLVCLYGKPPRFRLSIVTLFGDLHKNVYLTSLFNNLRPFSGICNLCSSRLPRDHCPMSVPHTLGKYRHLWGSHIIPSFDLLSSLAQKKCKSGLSSSSRRSEF